MILFCMTLPKWCYTCLTLRSSSYRWLQPPAHWITAAPESRELLALCLRKLRGLSKVRIIDASFIWTEPHSRRMYVFSEFIPPPLVLSFVLPDTFRDPSVRFRFHYLSIYQTSALMECTDFEFSFRKVRITIQQEAFQGTILQQTFEVEYVVAYHQCPDCAKSFTANTWRAVVQVRQKVPHKRTFLYLEQLILKHSAHKDTINIRYALEL